MSILKRKIALLLFSMLFLTGLAAQTGTAKELYRPDFHFSPKKGWMNDPNGLVYHEGEYHLFFQHNPNATVWGPMHWGHAVSKDLVNWKELPIALYPDSLGTIFSGSAVVDKDNTAGFGKNAMVAIFTHHNPELERKRTGLHQYQSLAYSNDKGRTWTKFSGNPVLPNPGIWDFRDPKVIWHEESKQWVMILATKQSITFYTSSNLKEWSRSGEFGQGFGAHTGVWECPDLLKIKTAEGDKWVLLVSLNAGGPNKGSATQYFVGDFNGKNFSTTQTDIRWMDYGPDNYAGITFANLAKRHILIGWMSNWEYANNVPASTWRSAMTIARELLLVKKDGKWLLTSQPVAELQKIAGPRKIQAKQLKGTGVNAGNTFKLSFSAKKIEDFEFSLSSGADNELRFGYDKTSNTYYINRSKAGHVNFNDRFIQQIKAPRIATSAAMNYTVVIDKNSIEIFTDDGITNLTGLFFSEVALTQLKLTGNINMQQLKLDHLEGVPVL